MIIEFRRLYNLKQIEELLLAACPVCCSYLTIQRFVTPMLWRISCSQCRFTVMTNTTPDLCFGVDWIEWDDCYLVRACWQAESEPTHLQLTINHEPTCVIDGLAFDFNHWLPKMPKLALLA